MAFTDYTKDFRGAAEQMSGRLSETEGLWKYMFIAAIAALASITWNMFWWGVVGLRMVFA